MTYDWILASDIDHTLTGDRAALDELAGQLEALRQQQKLFLILSTGRRLDQVLAGFTAEGLPFADAIISQVGTEIYLPPYHENQPPLAVWQAELGREFRRETAVSLLTHIPGLVMQPDQHNTPLKASCYLDQTPDPDAAAAEIARRVTAAGLDHTYQVVWSSGQHLDIIPAAAGKGKAIRFLLEHLSLTAGTIIVAGDSGNDRSMFDTFPAGIVVANAQAELQQMRPARPAPPYFARRPYAAGVAEGLRHYGVPLRHSA